MGVRCNQLIAGIYHEPFSLRSSSVPMRYNEPNIGRVNLSPALLTSRTRVLVNHCRLTFSMVDFIVKMPSFEISTVSPLGVTPLTIQQNQVAVCLSSFPAGVIRSLVSGPLMALKGGSAHQSPANPPPLFLGFHSIHCVAYLAGMTMMTV